MSDSYLKMWRFSPFFPDVMWLIIYFTSCQQFTNIHWIIFTSIKEFHFASIFFIIILVWDSLLSQNFESCYLCSVPLGGVL